MKHCLFTLLFLFLFTVTAFAKVNINTADVEELTSLPGIGTKKAEAIIKDRAESGKFNKVEDLTRVKGIGDKMVMKLKDEITIGK